MVVSHDGKLSWVVFIVASSPSLPASEDESGDGSDSDDADEDDGASSLNGDEIST